MASRQCWPEGLFHRLCNTVPMALMRQQLETSKRDTLAFGLNPVGNFSQCLRLLWERSAFVGGKQSIVIGLCFEVLTFLRRNAQLRQMFVPDADPFTGVAQCALRKTILPAQGITSDIAEQRHVVLK